MGYRSKVRSLIYGDPDEVCGLVAAHTLTGGKIFISDEFEGSISRYRITRQVYNSKATAKQPCDDRGYKKAVHDDVETEVIDLYAEDVKWYDDYSSVKAWHQLMDAAAELGLTTEFLRIGEESGDIDQQFNPADDVGEQFLYVTREIVDEMPGRRPVDYEKEAQHANHPN